MGFLDLFKKDKADPILYRNARTPDGKVGVIIQHNKEDNTVVIRFLGNGCERYRYDDVTMVYGDK